MQSEKIVLTHTIRIDAFEGGNVARSGRAAVARSRAISTKHTGPGCALIAGRAEGGRVGWVAFGGGLRDVRGLGRHASQGDAGLLRAA